MKNSRFRSWLLGVGAAVIGMWSVDSHAQVVISQVYGGGGNSGAPFNQDFVELFNQGDTAVDITGWSFQYASSTGTSWTVNPVGGFPATTMIGPGEYFLVASGSTGASGVPLPTPDATGTSAMASSNGKVALVSDSTQLPAVTDPTGEASVVDFVGYGSANAFEGTAAAPALNNSTSAVRLADGCIDTDDNGDDFTTASPPTPRNSASPTNDCSVAPDPEFTAYSISGDEILVTFQIAPTEPVIAGDFSLNDSAAVTVTGANDEGGDVYTLTLSGPASGDGVQDTLTYDNGVDNPATFDFHAGISSLPDFRDDTIGLDEIITVDVTVTAVSGSNVTAQTTGEASPAGHGILFFSSSLGAAVSVDEDIRVAGTTSEFVQSGSGRKQLASPVLISQAAGTPVAPTTIPAGDFLRDNTEGANPAEQWEGVLITVEDLVHVGDIGFGEDEFSHTSGNVLTDDVFFLGSFTPGNTYDITGIGWASFGDYKIQPRDANDIVETATSVNDWSILE